MPSSAVRLAARVSGSYRGSGDYAPGGGDAIETSGYEKRNLAAAATLRLAEGHELTAQLVTDDAWLIGYPALLMDAVLAQARIGSVAYEGRAPGLERLDARLYRAKFGGQSLEQRARFPLAYRGQRVEQRDMCLEIVAFGREMRGSQGGEARVQFARQLRGDDQRGVTGFGHISPRLRRISNHLATFRLCSSSVSAKACPPVPSATI